MRIKFILSALICSSHLACASTFEDIAAIGAPQVPVQPMESVAGQAINAISNLEEAKAWYLSEERSCSPIQHFKSDPALAEQFEKSAYVWEGYTIEQHTDRVLKRFDQFKEIISLPSSINHHDFVLFLSLHDIGKALAREEAARGLYNTSFNQKTLELMYSRRIFKKVAREIGMPPRVIKILSRLLHSDTIGEYLKEDCSVESARNLLIRDASKCGLSPESFFNLHMIFHQIDAGSYDALAPLFMPDKLTYSAERQANINRLSTMFSEYNMMERRLLSGETIDLMNKESLAQLEAYMYNLRLLIHYGSISRFDITKHLC